MQQGRHRRPAPIGNLRSAAAVAQPRADHADFRDGRRQTRPVAVACRRERRCRCSGKRGIGRGPARPPGCWPAKSRHFRRCGSARPPGNSRATMSAAPSNEALSTTTISNRTPCGRSCSDSRQARSSSRQFQLAMQTVTSIGPSSAGFCTRRATGRRTGGTGDWAARSCSSVIGVISLRAGSRDVFLPGEHDRQQAGQLRVEESCSATASRPARRRDAVVARRGAGHFVQSSA